MALHKLVGDRQAAPACFLCALEPDPCTVARLEGLIIAANETELDGAIVPWVTLKVEGNYASVTLNRYYRGLVIGLRALGGSLEKYRLTLRVYHLPPATSTTVHHGRSVDRYRAS